MPCVTTGVVRVTRMPITVVGAAGMRLVARLTGMSLVARVTGMRLVARVTAQVPWSRGTSRALTGVRGNPVDGTAGAPFRRALDVMPMRWGTPVWRCLVMLGIEVLV